MTKEDAIYEIKQLAVLSNEKDIVRITEALEMAIEALQVYEPQTNADQHAQRIESVETMSCQECKHYEVGKPCKPFLNECDCHYEPQTDCPWQNDEHIPTELASTMLKERFKEQK